MIHSAGTWLPASGALSAEQSAVDGLVKALEIRDPHTNDHSMHVQDWALKLAADLGLSELKQHQVALGAKLHDIGKLKLPDSILNKPGRLTDAEWAKVREHPVMGEEMLAPFVHSKTVLAAIRGHHERFDGAGYPDGLAGEGIALAARIVAIADCFDALTRCRPYRLAMPKHVALDLICEGSGTKFDPRLVDSFVRLVAIE